MRKILIMLVFVLVLGCDEEDPRSIAVKTEEHQYRIVSVHGQRGGVLVNIEGIKNKHRASAEFWASRNEPLPEPNEIWYVEYKKDHSPPLKLIRRIKEAPNAK